MDSIVNFRYSRPYELTLARLGSLDLDQDHTQSMDEQVTFIQQLWDQYEVRVLKLFKEMYQIKIEKVVINGWISAIIPNSFSDPLTISLKRYTDITTSSKTQRLVMYEIIHELAHYFAYMEEDDSYSNSLWDKILERNLLKDRGANLHFLIQAVEFGVGAEIFGEESAINRREFMSQFLDNEYGVSAKMLIDLKVPLNKSCLKFIEQEVLS